MICTLNGFFYDWPTGIEIPGPQRKVRLWFWTWIDEHQVRQWEKAIQWNPNRPIC